MKKTTKLVALVLATVMMLTGCGANEVTPAATDNTAAQTQTVDNTTTATEPTEMVEINVMVYDRGVEFAPGNSLTDNELTRWVNSQMEPQGVHVNYVPVPRSGADNEVNLMLAAGTAPDVIRTYDAQRVATYALQGGLADLTNYVDKLDPDFVAKNQDAFEACKIDGTQWAFPGVYTFHGKSNETYLRQDLVEAMGMEMPKTRDELIDVLYAMKKNFPDIIPYGFSGKIQCVNYTTWLLSYTSRADERINYMYEPTFTIVLKPGHKEGLRQLNQFVLDGIIDPDFALDTDSTIYNQNVANGKFGFVADNSGDSIVAYATAEDPNYHMVEVDCIENADGNYDVPSQGAFSHFVYVPKTAEDKLDAIVKYLNFLSIEENAIQVNAGVIGFGADLNDAGFPVSRSKADRIAAGTTPNPSDSGFMINNFAYEFDNLVPNFLASNPAVPEDVAEGKYASQYSNYFDACTISSVLPTDEYVPLLQTLIVEFVFKCMSAPEGKFDEVYEQEYQILLDNHLQEVLDARGAWYDANH